MDNFTIQRFVSIIKLGQADHLMRGKRVINVNPVIANAPLKL